jgi:hypothetical protein
MLASLLLAGAQLGYPLDARSDENVRISSQIDCKSWSEARAKGTSVNYEHYAQGFLDGFSLGARLDFWGASESNRLVPSNAFFRLDDYCKANPGGTVLEGAFRVFKARRKELTATAPKSDDKKKR